MSLARFLSVLLLLTLDPPLWATRLIPGRVSGATNKFTNKDKMQCTWNATGPEEKMTLSVTCENPEARIIGGETDLQCDYNGRPALCPGFRSNPRVYWKQVARALKRLQGKLCKDRRALVKAGTCKSAPRDTHFKLVLGSAVSSAQSGGIDIPPPPGSTVCTRTHRQTAEEYCSHTWASVCTFFLAMLQKENC
ncbi:fibroblast growth factor-binding protein 1-like [Synchiropus splendidus]|uniref:fibroblast growth factor-binding protein 1-like n=1 Tax=Synchiropus splendidus TaxID=270530 RepID=UPI00237DEE9D|nr:fibroblast growth factor-binding protein 1-like [Synchiropus splendidus]